MQAPAMQASPEVHAEPSSQAAVLLVNTQPLAGLQLSSVHGLLSLQTTGEVVQPVAGSQESTVQALPSSQSVGAPPWQAPARQASPEVHGLPSSHAGPAADAHWAAQPPMPVQAGIPPLPVAQFAQRPSHDVSQQKGSTAQTHAWQVAFEQPGTPVAVPQFSIPPSGAVTHPVAGSQESAVQTFPSLQAMGLPAQLPPPQTSPLVQALLSLQGAVLLVNTQPVAGLQLSSVQTLPSSQTVGPPGTQAPLSQESPVVHAFPSSQAIGTPVCVHAPPQTAGSRALLAQMRSHAVSQQKGSPAQIQAVHAAESQPSPPWLVPQLPIGPVPLVAGAVVQPVAGSQLSVVQGLPSSQRRGSPPQLPRSQMSATVQALPSSQLAVLLLNTQPDAGAQESSVHGLLSLHTIGVPTQPVAGSQLSVVQALLSLQTMGEVVQPVAALQESAVQALPSLHEIGANTQPVAGLHESVVQALLSLHTTGVVVQPVAGLHASVVQEFPSLQI
jgi:hypothetical protein